MDLYQTAISSITSYFRDLLRHEFRSGLPWAIFFYDTLRRKKKKQINRKEKQKLAKANCCHTYNLQPTHRVPSPPRIEPLDKGKDTNSSSLQHEKKKKKLFFRRGRWWKWSAEVSALLNGYLFKHYHACWSCNACEVSWCLTEAQQSRCGLTKRWRHWVSFFTIFFGILLNSTQ